MLQIKKFSPFIVILSMVIFFIGSFVFGTFLVNKSEKEINPKKHLEEAEAKTYTLREIDSKTGALRWELTAKEGKTENNLQATFIKDIKAEIYKNNEVIFELKSPEAKANATTKEIYLFDNVTVKDKKGKFLLECKQLSLGMGTSIEAQNGFKLVLINNGTINGEHAIINDDQTKITVRNLKEAELNDIKVSGGKVQIERNQNGDLLSINISDHGKVILRKPQNDTLEASSINWNKNGEVTATDNVTYKSKDKTFTAEYLHIESSGNLTAKNNVQISHGKTKCFGNLLTYNNNNLVTITGNTKAVQENKEIKADKIFYNINTGKVEAIGDVKSTVSNKV